MITPATIADYHALYRDGYMRSSFPWQDPPLMWLLDRLPASILDVGGGSGAFAKWIRQLTGGGSTVDTVDPAFGGDALPNISHEWATQYVTCFDVLEHLPEDLVPSALGNLYMLSGLGCVCSIANMEETREVNGRVVDLHPTRRGPDWWLERFRAVFLLCDITYRPLHYPERFWIIAERL